MASYGKGGGVCFCDNDDGEREIIAMGGEEEDRSLCLSSGQDGCGFWDFCEMFMRSLLVDRETHNR